MGNGSEALYTRRRMREYSRAGIAVKAEKIVGGIAIYRIPPRVSLVYERGGL
jgi:hypothetical protein